LKTSEGHADFVELRFAKGETRHVPITDLVRIWSYGASLPKKKLDKVSGSDWIENQSVRLASAVQEIRHIKAAYKMRDATTGCGLKIVDEDLIKAAQGFAHDLTEDQRMAITSISADLRSETPANHLVLGDVGCGKTEVAARLAFAAVMSGHSVRLAAPTRVLARQHFDELSDRAQTLGIEIALLTGDTPKIEKARIKASSSCKLLIGTHGVLSTSHSTDFDLTIIDEEQKFGRKIKSHGLDVSSGQISNLIRLSATPIPKTIAEVKVGLANVSVITAFPASRGKRKTIELSNDDEEVKSLIQSELARDGQVFFIVPRVKDIEHARTRLKNLFPEESISHMHGRRKARQNRRAIRKFQGQQSRTICATSMMETGINVPNANLMIVQRADRFGVAQLHQLRGRVGRGARDATFAVLSHATTSKSYKKRLRSLRRFNTSDAGIRLALSDAFLRGSGKFSDATQTGHSSAIGLELFEYLLAQSSVEDGEISFDTIPKIVGRAEWGISATKKKRVANHFIRSREAISVPSKVLGRGDATFYDLAIAACVLKRSSKVGAVDGRLIFVDDRRNQFSCPASPDGMIGFLTNELIS